MDGIELSCGKNPSHRSWRGTCWRKYGRLQGLQRTTAHTRSRPNARKGGTRRHQPSYVPDQRYGSTREHRLQRGINVAAEGIPLDRGHHDYIATWGMACSCLRNVSPRTQIGLAGDGERHNNDNNEQDGVPWRCNERTTRSCCCESWVEGQGRRWCKLQMAFCDC